MSEFQVRSFAYAHSNAVIEGIRAKLQNTRHYIADGYAHIDAPGEDEQFQKMIEIAKKGGHDILYVDSVKEFAGHSLADFKKALTDIEKAGMKVVSTSEKGYDYQTFMTAIEILEELTPEYEKSRRRIAAVTMHAMGAEVRQICKDLEMPESEVYQAIASYKRSLEELEARQAE